MKALSIHPYYAMGIMVGEKTVECRSWKTDYRGDILICATQKKYPGTIPGHALGVVELIDVVLFKKKHLKDALMDDYNPGDYAWILTNNRLIEPIPVKGKLSLWNFDDEDKIKYIPEEEWVLKPRDDPDEPGDWYKKFWEPLMV